MPGKSQAFELQLQRVSQGQLSSCRRLSYDVAGNSKCRRQDPTRQLAAHSRDEGPPADTARCVLLPM